MIVVYTTTLSSSLAIKKKCQEVLNFLQAHKVSSNFELRYGFNACYKIMIFRLNTKK